jgi:hypothetical protein
MTSTPTTTPAPVRLPTLAEMDELCGRAILEGLREALEERERDRRRRAAALALLQGLEELIEEQRYCAKLVRPLQARSRQVAERDRRRPRLVWDRDRGIIEKGRIRAVRISD